jgi:heavy metal translocating P-type ATPase
VLVAIAAAGLAFGLAIRFAGFDGASNWIWGAATLPILLSLAAEIFSSLRRGNVGLDIVAALSMTAALIFGEELAAAVVALMYAGGQYLESFAEQRARREMTALLERVPRTAARYAAAGIVEVPLERLQPGDRVLVRRGDTVPVDGTVSVGVAVLDQSALTGEPLPVRQQVGEAVMSGATNVGDAFDLAATRRADESTYAGIVRLVEGAQRSKAPMSRLADRYALLFLMVTVGLAAAAWILTNDPIRAVAVLVIATPCPLILAVPVAIVAGLSRAARHGVLIKGAQTLEAMARVRALVIDKTGTLTTGRAALTSIAVLSDVPADEILRLAASLDQASPHVVARTIVAEATKRGMALAVPTDVSEVPGEGIEGMVEGKRLFVGGTNFLRSRLSAAMPATRSRPNGAITVAVAVDGRLAGELILADGLRPGVKKLLDDFRSLGIDRIVLATGDRHEVADEVAARLPIDAVRADLTPDQKIVVVLSERKNGPVMMIGDGVNDAPALAAADVGVAMGARGAAASAEAADAVLLVDHLDGVVVAIRIARRSRFIALESVYAGIGLSIVGMIAAAFGYLTPVEGALIQEVIDVVVILNALRALAEGAVRTRA